MAGEKGKSRMSRRTLFLILYMAVYAAFRWNGDIIHQEARTNIGGQAGKRHIVGAGAELPHWLRQTYRAVFSPLMVAEEEGRRLAGEAGETARELGSPWP